MTDEQTFLKRKEHVTKVLREHQQTYTCLLHRADDAELSDISAACKFICAHLNGISSDIRDLEDHEFERLFKPAYTDPNDIAAEFVEPDEEPDDLDPELAVERELNGAQGQDDVEQVAEIVDTFAKSKVCDVVNQVESEMQYLTTTCIGSGFYGSGQAAMDVLTAFKNLRAALVADRITDYSLEFLGESID